MTADQRVLTDVSLLPPAPAVAAEPNVGRAAMLGVAVGFVVVAPLVALLGWLSGSGPMGAVGLGVFVGSWGGAGFGGMLGATIAVIRHETATPAFLPNPSAVGYRDAA